MRNLSFAALASCLILTAGCATTTEEVESASAWSYAAQNTGQVVLVNKELSYVVLETVTEPAAGQEVDVKRNGRLVGRLKVSDQHAAPYVVADILSGSLEVGDALLLRPKGVGEQP